VFLTWARSTEKRLGLYAESVLSVNVVFVAAANIFTRDRLDYRGDVRVECAC
jgi:hypothetical protein